MYIYRYIHPFIFSLATIIPMPPDEVGVDEGCFFLFVGLTQVNHEYEVIYITTASYSARGRQQ